MSSSSSSSSSSSDSGSSSINSCRSNYINRVRFDLIKIWRFHTIVLHIVLADYRTLLKTSLNSIGQ